MSIQKRAQRVRVRGECAAGHVFEGVAPRGRLRYEGDCPVEGCELPLVARRVAEPVSKPKSAEIELPTGSKVKRVKSYARAGRGSGSDTRVAPADSKAAEPTPPAGVLLPAGGGRRGPERAPARRRLEVVVEDDELFEGIIF